MAFFYFSRILSIRIESQYYNIFIFIPYIFIVVLNRLKILRDTFSLYLFLSLTPFDSRRSLSFFLPSTSRSRVLSVSVTRRNR